MTSTNPQVMEMNLGQIGQSGVLLRGLRTMMKGWGIYILEGIVPRPVALPAFVVV